MKKKRVVALHFTDLCNMLPPCPFCYRRSRGEDKRSLSQSFLIDMVPFLAEITEQVACGGGEPYMEPEFIEDFSKVCDDYDLTVNVTTNGSLPDRIIKYSKYVTMVSVSYDSAKWRTIQDFMLTLHKLREHGLRLGVNLLVEKDTFSPPLKFVSLVDLFLQEAERVFALFPKLTYFVPILDYRMYYLYLTLKHKHFYIDDATYSILCNESYNEWKSPCHFGKDIVSINPRGYVTGCSFDGEDKAVLKLDKPSDLLKIRDLEFEERFSCPHILVT